MKELMEFFERKDRFAALAGIELLEIGEGYAKARMKIEERHLNGVDVVHGAAIFTLADLAFAAASNSHGTVALAINVNISFMKAARSGTLTAEARELTRNPKLGTYEVRITDDAEDLVAIFQGMVYRKKERLLDSES